MLSLQSQLCIIRGAFHLRFKRKRKKIIGLKVFLTMLVVFGSTQSSNLWALKVSAALTKHSAVTALNHQEATD